MRTEEIKIYQFAELSEDAKQVALEQCAYYNVGHEWWESTYEDAKTIGLKITGFELDRDRQAKGELTLSANEVAQNIFNNHGETCETFKIAKTFMEAWQPVFNDYMDEASDGHESADNEDKMVGLEGEFVQSLLEDYSIMLQNEYDYLTSEQAIVETIEANEYEFTSDGKRY